MSEPMMRIQARTGQIKDGPDKGKWGFEVTLSAIGLEELGPPFLFGPFETEPEAKIAMRESCKNITQKLEEMQTGKISGKYYDMKQKITRNWEEH